MGGDAQTGDAAGRVAVVDASTGPELGIVESGGTARAVIWPGMGAELRSVHRVSLEPKGRTIVMSHESEAVYYVISGSGAVCEVDDAPTEALIEGSMVHIDAGDAYAFCASSEGMELVGGPSPADHSLYEGLGRAGGA